MQETDTIKVSNEIFDSHAYGRYNTHDSNIYLWIPHDETKKFIVHSRIIHKNMIVDFFDFLHFTLEHEILHGVINELEDFNTSAKLDNLVQLIEELDLKGTVLS